MFEKDRRADSGVDRSQQTRTGLVVTSSAARVSSVRLQRSRPTWDLEADGEAETPAPPTLARKPPLGQ